MTDDAGEQTAEAAKPDREPDKINRTFGLIVRRQRQKSGLTLEQLATASGVSRAMLSSVERGEKSPTLSVLAGIASGLNVSMSHLMAEDTDAAAATVIRRGQRLVFHDRLTGIERHLLSPTHLSSGVEVIEHVLPAGQHFAGVPQAGVLTEKYVIVRSGQLKVELGGTTHLLEAEDTMHFHANGTYDFVNDGLAECRYYIFIVHKDATRQ